MYQNPKGISLMVSWVAGAGGQDSGHQPYHDPSVHLGEKMNLPEDHISPLGTGGGPVYQ